MKKVLTLVFAVVLIFSVALTASAASATTINLKQTNSTVTSFGYVDPAQFSAWKGTLDASNGAANPAIWHFVLSSKKETSVSKIDLTYKDASGVSRDVTGMTPATNGGGKVNGWLVKTPGDWTLVSGYVTGSGLSGNFNLSTIGYVKPAVPPVTPPVTPPADIQVSITVPFMVVLMDNNNTMNFPSTGQIQLNLAKETVQYATTTNDSYNASFTISGDSIYDIIGSYTITGTGANVTNSPSLSFTITDDGTGFPVITWTSATLLQLTVD